jgi:hypothetical protein
LSPRAANAPNDSRRTPTIENFETILLDLRQLNEQFGFFTALNKNVGFYISGLEKLDQARHNCVWV